MRCFAALGPKLEGRPQALLAHRLIDVAIAAIGFAALLGLGLVAQFPRQEVLRLCRAAGVAFRRWPDRRPP